MKKLLLAAVAFVALFAMSADARHYKSCNTCPTKVAKCCKEKVLEEACPVPPCCVRYVRVEEPAIRTKHVSYSWECPSSCATEAPRIDGNTGALLHEGAKVSEY
jgi:hypothetical protein